MDLTRLEELKRKLVQDKALPPVWTFFLDHLGQDPAFIRLGEETRHEFVEAALAEVCRQLYPKAEAIVGLILTRLAEQQFLHGGFFVAGRPGGLFYFEDIRMGLITVAELPPSIEVKYCRFSGQPLRPPAPPSVN
jgi:hypothetical protein